MKRARFTEQQIIAVLREHEARAKTADLARKHGVSEATLYNLKAKFGGMDVSEAKRLKQLEDENAKLKKLLAEQMLGATAMRSFCKKNTWLAVKREAVAQLRAMVGMSERRACSIVGADREMVRYRSRRPPSAGCGTAGAVARPGQRAPAFWLSAAVRPSALRRRTVRDQPHLAGSIARRV